MDIVVMMMKFKYLNGREAWEYMETLNITSSKALFGFTTYGSSAATAGFSGMSTASMGRELPPHTLFPHGLNVFCGGHVSLISLYGVLEVFSAIITSSLDLHLGSRVPLLAGQLN